MFESNLGARWALPLFAALTALLVAAACGGDSGGGSTAVGGAADEPAAVAGADQGAGGAESGGGPAGGSEPVAGAAGAESTEPEPTPTELGEPMGEPVTRVIGADGGSLLSADGRVELRVPPRALTDDTEVSIQAVANTAHGGVGDGYELLPDGLVFAEPAELVLHYGAEDVEGTAPELLAWAFQDSQRMWRVLGTAADVDAETVVAETSHFTRFSPMSALRLSPPAGEVKVEGFAAFEVQYCVELGQRIDGETVFAFACRRGDAFIASRLGQWKVDGIVGGNSTVGTAGGTFVERVSYEAPAKVPSPDTVTLAIDFKDLTGNQAELSARVRILPDGTTYRGDYEFENVKDGNGQETVATAHLVWEPDVMTSQLESYRATGTIDATLTLFDCDPVQVSLPIQAGTLVYYTDQNPVLRSQQVFNVGASGEIVASCGDPRAPTTKTVSVAAPLSTCAGTEPAPDRDVLSGTTTCDDATMERTSWSFRRGG